MNKILLSLDIQPSPEVLEHCAAFLLNVKDWTYLSNMQNTDSGHIEVIVCLRTIRFGFYYSC